MTLTIHKLTTRCRSPKSVPLAGALVDDAARGLLATELDGQLGPSLDRLPAVVRLKQLSITIKIPARKLSVAALANAWGRAISVALHQTLARPSIDPVISPQRYESDIAYKAAMLHHIATQGLRPVWNFPELTEWNNSSPSEAMVGILRQDAALMVRIMAEMDRHGWLDSLLAALDELSLELIMQAIAGAEGAAAGLSLARLVELGRGALARGALRPQWAFSGRRQALRLWTRLHPRFAIREVWHGLRLLLRFLEMPALLALRDPALLAGSIPFPPWCEAIVRSGGLPSSSAKALNTLASISTGALVAPPTPDNLLSVLRELQPLVSTASPSLAADPTAARPAGAPAQWIVSNCAGILLLASIVRRLNLWRFARTPEFTRFGGPRAFSFLLAATGMTLLGRWTPGDEIDPAIAVFAGMFHQPDLAGMKHFFAESTPAMIADFVKGENWEAILNAAATELTRSFAGRVRGFRHATREAVVKQFLRVPGRVLIEPARILAVLESTPWSVAVRISGMDEPLERVEWLDERRLEFVLEGL
jgi:hypothetical protein